MKEHYFCVRAIQDGSGELKFNIDHETAEARFPDGAMFDTETGQWSLVSDEMEGIDNQMVMKLTELINDWEEITR